MKVVHKYPLEISSEPIRICLDSQAELLSVQYQSFPQNCPMGWFLVDTEPEREYWRTFHWVATGQELPQVLDTHELRYHATVQVGEFVFHLFEDYSYWN